jgi:type 2 lantibiotic biosynthesis protein LanM
MPVSPEQLWAVVARAATLSERMQWASDPGASGSGMGPDELPEFASRWRSAVAGESDTRWSRRLAWDGFSPEQVDRARRALPHRDALPDWAHVLRELSADARRLAQSESMPEFSAAAKRIAFSALLEPFVCVADRRIAGAAEHLGDRLSSPARRALLDGLSAQLSGLAVRTLFHEFQAERIAGSGGAASVLQAALNGGSRRRYDVFARRHLADGLESLLSTYPVLARLLASRVLHWISNTEQFLTRLARDWEAITRVFGFDIVCPDAVTAIDTNLSDCHRGGATVSVLHFAGGFRVVYKPRSMRVDRCFYELVNHLNALHGGAAMQSLALLEGDGYGWTEFAQARPCTQRDEVERFFERGGMLVALSYVLGASDLHSANVLACGEHPVLIDLEVMCNPLVNTGVPAEKSGRRHAHATVLSSALLPCRSSAAGKDFVDGGLLDRTERQVYQRETLRFANTDMMSWGTYEFIGGGRENVPTLDGRAVRTRDYLPAIMSGFTAMYETLLVHRAALLAEGGPLRDLERASVRVVHRPTSAYDRLSNRTLHPRYMRIGVDRSIEFERLNVESLAQSRRPSIWTLFGAEQRELEQGDIPIFSAVPGSRTLWSGGGAVANDALLDSGFDGLLDRMAGLCADDLRQQLDLIRIAFAGADDYALRLAERDRPVPEDTDAEVLAEAESIGNTLLRLRQRGDDAGWLGLSGRDARSTRLQPLDAGLFDGVTGIALFLATLSTLVPTDAFRDAAEDSLRPVRRALRDTHHSRALVTRLGIGGAYGIGGVVYALTRCAALFGDASYLADASVAAALISDEQIALDRSLDAMFGSAGALIALLALHRATGDSAHLSRALRCGERLEARQLAAGHPQAGHWQTGADTPETGVAHGTAGILLALARLLQVSPSDNLAQSVRAASAALSSQYDGAHRNWRDAVGQESPGAGAAWSSWCRGAAGIGMVHLAIHGAGQCEAESQVSAACANVSERDFPSKDHLCCGTSGRIDFLLRAGAQLGRHDLLATARAKSLRIRRDRVARGSYATGYVTELSPGLFQGIAGIGYGMLRVASPQTVPSVLMWD